MIWFGKRKPIRRRKPTGRRNHPVAKILENNQGCALTVEVISKAMKMNKNTVRSMLRRLVGDGYVAHMKPFFYWK